MFNMDEETEKYVDMYFRINKKIDALNTKKTILRKRIIKMIGEKKKLTCFKYTASYSKFKMKRLSEKKIKEILYAMDLNEVYDSCTYETESERLTIKERSGSEIF